MQNLIFEIEELGRSTCVGCGMKRYFFDYHDNGSCERDEIGLEFDSLEAASKEAERALSEFASDVLPDGADRRISIDVRSGEDVVFQTGMRIQSGLTD